MRFFKGLLIRTGNSLIVKQFSNQKVFSTKKREYLTRLLTHAILSLRTKCFSNKFCCTKNSDTKV